MHEISNDLHISRTHTSLLVGTGFAVVFSLAGIAVALFLSHIQPRRVVGVGVVVWSLATVACAFAQTPAVFLIARMGVGIGEAALVPMAYTWISMRAPHQRLGIAMACFTMGVSLGNGASLGIGGQVIEWLTAIADSTAFGLSPWRTVLAVCGFLGLPIAVLVMLVDRAPVQGIARPDFRSGWPRPLPPLCVFLGFACIVGVYYIQLFWAVEFFRTRFGLGLSGISLLLGIAAGPGVAVGALIGGAVGDRIATRQIVLPHAQMMIWASTVQLCLFALAFVVKDVWISIGAYVAAMVAHGAVGGAMGPSIAQLFSTEKRALATSIGISFTTFGGLGVAMPLVGWMAEVWGIQSAMAWSAAILLLASIVLLALARQRRRVQERRTRAHASR